MKETEQLIDVYNLLVSLTKKAKLIMNTNGEC